MPPAGTERKGRHGPRVRRPHREVSAEVALPRRYIPAGALLLIALLASTAADVAVLVPPILLLALAGLALVGVLVSSLREIARGPLLLGPIFAFSIALSDIRLLSLGPFFWSLVLGTGVSLLLERDEWKRLRVQVVGSGEAASGDFSSRTKAT